MQIPNKLLIIHSFRLLACISTSNIIKTVWFINLTIEYFQLFPISKQFQQA